MLVSGYTKNTQIPTESKQGVMEEFRQEGPRPHTFVPVINGVK